MRIVLLAEVFKPIQNSVTLSVELIKSELVKFGHDVRIITPNPRNVQLSDKRVYHVPGIPFPGNSGYQMSFPELSDASKIMEKADVIHAMEPFILGKWGQKIAIQNNIPFVFTSHQNSLSYNNFVPVVGGILKKPFSGYLKKFFSGCNVIIAPTKSMQLNLKKQKIKNSILQISDGIEIKYFAEGSGVNLRKKLGILPSDNVLVHTGSITEEKRVRLLINTISEIKEKPKLIIAGNGSELASMRDLVNKHNLENQVFLLGQCNYKDMPEIYHAGDIFVSCSPITSDSLAIKEALACELPVVVMNTPGIKDIVLNGINGFVTKSTKVAFGNAIRNIINRPQLFAKLKRGAKKTSKKYSIENTTEAILSAYRLAINLKKDQG